MHPVLFRIPVFGGLVIHSYGVMVASGFVAGMTWVYFESKRIGQDPSRNLDLVFYILVSAIIGSKLFYIIVSQREAFLQNPLILFEIWRGGLVFYGGLILSLITGVWYIRRHKMPMLTTLDIFAPAIAIGHSLGRIGCFLAGCCYGKPVLGHHWYSVVFPPNPSCFAPTGIGIYPTQLMESAGEVIIFTVLFFLSRAKKFDGQIMASYMMLYSILRFSDEFLRGDMIRGFVISGVLSTSQFISIFIFATGAYMYARLYRKSRIES